MGIGLAGQAIIMKGLTCGKTRACQGGALITAGPLSIFCLPFDPDLTPIIPQGGGGRPMQPGEISQLYQPVPEQFYVVDRRNEADYFRKRIPIKIALQFRGKTNEKEFLVPEERAKAIINVLNSVNKTKDRISVGVTSIKRIYNRIKIVVTKLRRVK